MRKQIAFLMSLTTFMSFANAVTMAQLPQQAKTVQTQINDALASLKGTLNELTALDESDKTLAQSNQVQTETHEMLVRAVNKLEHEKLPPLQTRSSANQAELKRISDSGCPTGGGMVPTALANRCNPLIDAYNAEYNSIEKEGKALTDEANAITATQEAINKTTIENARQQKANNARRDELLAARKLQEGILLKLKEQADGCKQLLRSRGYIKCETLKQRCGDIQFDGSNPNHSTSPWSPTDKDCK